MYRFLFTAQQQIIQWLTKRVVLDESHGKSVFGMIEIIK